MYAHVMCSWSLHPPLHVQLILYNFHFLRRRLSDLNLDCATLYFM